MQNRELDCSTVFQQLLVDVPEFKSIYDKHLDDYDELLPHVLLGDFTRFLVDAYRRSIKDATESELYHQIVTKSLDFLERAINASDPKLQELVSVSFLENLHQAEEVYEDIKALLGLRLRKELISYEYD